MIDFEHGERAKGERARHQGTVFQTAVLYIMLTQRLRPGLLSLRSVLASSQILLARSMVITNSRKWASV